MKKVVHIISHTHWDREWYLNSRFVNRWIPPFFDALFAMFEKEPEYRFVLDGQTSLLDDCYAKLQKDGKPVEEFKEKVRRYVQEGRLVIGPYYLQPDWQLASGEALVRNMLYGKLISKELGGKTGTGWLLDNFGQIAQAPQIHKEFGMKGIVVWRGVAFEPENMKSEFLWESPDGTRLPAVYLLSSYRNAMRLADDPDSIYGRIRNEAEKIQDFAQTGNVLLMNGYDQERRPDDILPYIKDGKADTAELTVRQSIPDEYMEAVAKGLPADVQTFRGALYNGRYISVFPGILSSRMYLKLKNDELQRRIEEETEPAGVMGALCGLEYPGDKLDEAWKLLLKNHPHDSICGVSVDDVHTDMEERFGQVEHMLACCTKEVLQGLAGGIDSSAFEKASAVFHVFHTMPVDRPCQVFFPVKGIIMPVVRDEAGSEYPCQETEGGIVAGLSLPAFGYGTYGVYETDGEAREEQKGEETDSNSKTQDQGTEDLPVLENDYLHIRFHKNGTFCLTDKKHGTVYDNMGYLEDMADSGDEYNYSWLTGDSPVTTLREEPEISVTEQGRLYTTVKVEYRLSLPAALAGDRKTRSASKETLPVVTFITLQKNSPVLRFRTVIRNRCKDHRIRVMFPTGLKTAHSAAQTQFDITCHPIVPEAFDNSSVPEKVQRIVIGARESKPITQFPQKDFTAVSDGTHGVAVLNRGLPEYEVLPEDTTVALTLFRSVGWLARVDLNTRIGDAGPEIFTPEAQCLREMEFQYGICLFEGPVEEAGLSEKAAHMNHGCTTVIAKAHPGRLPARHSFFSLASQGDISVSAVKMAQDGRGIIVRLFQTQELEQEAVLAFAETVEKAYVTNLAEENVAELCKGTQEVRISVPSRKIVTLRLVLPERTCKLPEIAEVSLCESLKREAFINCYDIPDAVTEEEVRQERLRAQIAKNEYEKAQSDCLAQAQEAGSGAADVRKGRELAVMKAKAEALHRASLEAELSAVFTWKKRQEILLGRDSEEFVRLVDSLEEWIQELADQLNDARIEKRVSEYRVDYYTHLEAERS